MTLSPSWPAWHRSSAVHLLRVCFLLVYLSSFIYIPKNEHLAQLVLLEKSFLHQSILCAHPPLPGLRWRRSGMSWAMWCTCGTRPIFVAELGVREQAPLQCLWVGQVHQRALQAMQSLWMGRICAHWDHRKRFLGEGHKSDPWGETICCQKPAIWPRRRLIIRVLKSKVEEVNLFYWVTGHTVSV